MLLVYNCISIYFVHNLYLLLIIDYNYIMCIEPYIYLLIHGVLSVYSKLTVHRPCYGTLLILFDVARETACKHMHIHGQ